MKTFGFARLGLVAASLLAAPLTTAVQAQEGQLFKNILGSIGVIPEDKDPIDYRERAPLVLPPRMDLREPAAPGSAQARNAQWPNDPDVAARRRQAAENNLPVTDTDLRRMNRGNTRLTVDEIRAGRYTGAGIPTAPQARSENAWIHPDVLRAQHKSVSPADAAGGESTRRSLTEPPSAYRQSATGQPIRGSFEAPVREDEADPKVFLRQQQQRRNQ